MHDTQHNIAANVKLSNKAADALDCLTSETIAAAARLHEATIALRGLAGDYPQLRPALDEFTEAFACYETLTSELGAAQTTALDVTTTGALGETRYQVTPQHNPA